MYMNTLPYFRGIEDNHLRGDPFDSVDEIQRGKEGYLTLPNRKKLTITNFELRLGPNAPDKINLFCMYALRPQHGTYPVPERNFEFGSHALVIFNVPQFFEKIKNTLEKRNINLKGHLVEYIDDEHIGEVGIFKKLNRFSYQSEWRLVTMQGIGQPTKWNIGSIKDISFIVESNNINNKL